MYARGVKRAKINHTIFCSLYSRINFFNSTYLEKARGKNEGRQARRILNIPTLRMSNITHAIRPGTARAGRAARIKVISTCITLLRHRRRCSSPRTVRNSGYSRRPTSIIAAINGITRNHVTKSRRFILSRRMHARV